MVKQSVMTSKLEQIWFVLTSSCFIYVYCDCLCIVVSNAYCFLFFFVMLPVSLDCQFFISPFGIPQRLFLYHTGGMHVVNHYNAEAVVSSMLREFVHKKEWPMQIQIPCAKKHSDSTKKFSETDIINMLEFLIDNIFVILGGRVFQQSAYLWVQTAPLLADLFLYS